jgi:hypothetical protein
MKELPTEVFLTIGKHLNQQDQKTCALVCRLWYNAFTRLIFSKAVLLTRSQVIGFLRQSNIKKQMTISLHLIEAISDDEFREFTESCPQVKDLTVFINFTHRLTIPSTVSLITRNWGAHLTKIRMDSLLLTEILPLLSHQLIDVTGDFDDLINVSSKTDLIPMPKLKVLYIENVERAATLTLFTKLRAAYPELTTLTVTGAWFSFPEDFNMVTPFPKLRSFHLTNCDDVTYCHMANFMRIVHDLDSFSLLRCGIGSYYILDEQKEPIYQVIPANFRLRDLKLDYIVGTRRETVRCWLDTLGALAQLRSLHIELKCQISDVTNRERVSLLDIITTLPYVRNLTIYGLAHLETVDGLADYLVGKVGFYEARSTMLRLAKSFPDSHNQNASILLRNKGSIDYARSSFEDEYEESSTNYVDHRSRYGYRSERDRIVWGIGEALTDCGAHIMVCKKKYPNVNAPNETLVTWDTGPKFAYNSRFNDHQSDFQSDLTVLRFEMATLRNQSYRWINAHCPLLTELHVLQTDIYPWCEIYLADLKHLHTFNWSLERFYEPYLWPAFQILGKGKMRIWQWDYESKSYKETNDEGCLADDFYKVILTLPPLLNNFTVNGSRIDLFTMD